MSKKVSNFKTVIFKFQTGHSIKKLQRFYNKWEVKINQDKTKAILLQREYYI